MAPLSVNVPEPALVTDPLPLITPAYEKSLDRLKASAALLSTSPVMLPLVPPTPIRRVPALMVVPPV